MTTKRQAPGTFDAAAEHSRKRSRPDRIANISVHIKPINLVRNAKSSSNDKNCINSNNTGEKAGNQAASVPKVTHELAGAFEVPTGPPLQGPSRGMIPESKGAASQRHALTVLDNGHIVDVNGFEIEDAEEQGQYPFLALSMETFVIVPDPSESASSTIEVKPKKAQKRNKRETLVFANPSRHMGTHRSQKPFKCNTCNGRFTRNDHLKRHNMTHTGERPSSAPSARQRSKSPTR